jgi:phosphohistidine phosphatase
VDLYLMRHGEAADAPRDRDRPLTARGRVQARTSAQGLKALGASPARLWHSPYLRAAETAAIVGEVFGLPPTVDERFVPDGDGDDCARFLLGERQGGLVVAHMPILPATLHALVGAGASFSTAGVAHVGIMGGHAVLVGLYSAAALERHS